MTRLVDDASKATKNNASAILQVDINNDIVLRNNHVSRDVDSSCCTAVGDRIGFSRSFSLDVDIERISRSKGNVRRWSQTLVLKNGHNSFREKAINGTTSGMQSGFLEPLIGLADEFLTCDASEVSEVDRLTQEIEQHDHLMCVTAQSEQSRIERLRALPKAIAVKREIRAKLSTLVTNKNNRIPISTFKRMKYAFAMWLSRTERSTANRLINIELWYDRLKRIEGHFGSAVGTYFRFLRSLFILNGFIAVISIGFIVTPQIMVNANDYETVSASNQQTSFRFSDIFTAQGVVADSIIFYGAYSNQNLNITAQNVYNIPHAYFMTMATMYIVIFVFVSINVAQSYRHSFIEEAGWLSNRYAHKLFSAWNFSISSQKAAHLKHLQIYYEINEVLADIQSKKTRCERWQTIYACTMNLTTHMVVFFVLVAFGVTQWSLLHSMHDIDMDESVWSSMCDACLIIGTIGVMQLVFEWLASLENYRSARMRLHVTLIRIYCLEMMLIGIQLCFCIKRNFNNPCWESAVGYEIYRLVVVDFVVFVLGGIAYHALRWAICQYVWPPLGLPEFNTAFGSLALVFNQSLLWVGLWFVPLLAPIVAIKMLVTFYLKEATLLYFCKPSTKLWRSSQTSTLLSALVFVSLLAIVATNGYILSEIKVSSDCGPFRNYLYMNNLLNDSIRDLTSTHIIWRIIFWFTKPAVIGGALLSMSAVTYYLRAKSKAHTGMVRILKDMIKSEARDKEFLLGHITRISNGNSIPIETKMVDKRLNTKLKNQETDVIVN